MTVLLQIHFLDDSMARSSLVLPPRGDLRTMRGKMYERMPLDHVPVVYNQDRASISSKKGEGELPEPVRFRESVMTP